MQAIILNRKITEDQSVIADILNENGELLKIKFPGILKSIKRSSYNIVPGTIWEFTLVGNPVNILIPRESNLISSPWGIYPTYYDLQLIHEMLSPVKELLPGDRYPAIFVFLQQILSHWKEMSLPEKEFAASKFILFVFSSLGFYHPQKICFVCKQTNFNSAGYFLEHGHICPNCASNTSLSSNEIILKDWLTLLESEKISLEFAPEQHAAARKLVLEAISRAHK